MPSKRSFFNKTLFKKHLSRFWPLWGGVSLVGAMFPLYLLLALMQQMPGIIEDRGLFREALYQIAAGFVPGFTCCYAILCVMAVWGYLYNARSVGLLHTLPVDRTCLFITNTLAALSMVLIPYAVTGGLVCLIALGWGFFDLVAVFNTVLAVAFITLLFTGVATLCAMMTGHGFVLPAFYLLANFLAFLMEVLVTNLAHEFLLGVPMMEDMGRLSFLSPIVKIYNTFSVYIERPEENVVNVHLQGLWVVALYALAGLALLAVSWVLYKRRHSESAGDVVAFRWLRPVFRYGVALLSGLTIGRLLYELMWRTLFQRGSYAQALPMAVCLFLGALLGYYAASMLLAKSRRVFGKKSLPGVGIVAAGTVALCLLVSVDVFGLERKIPELDEIESVTIDDRGESGPYDAAKKPDQVEALRALHQAIVADRSYIRSYVPNWNNEEVSTVSRRYVCLTYRLKDGSTLRREYSLWVTRSRVGTDGTYDNLLAAFYQDPVVRLDSVTVPDGAELDGMDIFFDSADNHYSVNTIDHAGGDDRETRQIYAALQKDGAEGNVPARDVRQDDYGAGPFSLRLEYFREGDSGRTRFFEYKRVHLAPSMTNTIETLVELGYITEENVEQWKRDLAEQEADEAAPYGDVVYTETYAVPVG